MMLQMRQKICLTLRAGCHSPCRQYMRMTPAPTLQRMPSMASRTELMTWGLVSKMLGQMKLRRWRRASSQPKPCTPRARCLMAAAAVWRCTRSRSVSASSSSGVTAQMQSFAISPTYSNMKARLFSTPFCTFSSCTRYSFIRAGSTVNGPHDSETIAIATVVQTLSCRSCTLRLFSSVTRTSCGPMALAMQPKVVTVARRMFFLWALSSSSRSKQMRIHSLGETSSAPLSAMRPTSSMQFSCTFSFLFLRMGVSRGSRSLMGGVILPIPTSSTMLFSAPRMLPSTSGYSSRRHSLRFSPSRPSRPSSPQIFMGRAILATRSAACWRMRMLLWLSRQWMVPTICTKYGLARSPSAPTTAPNPSRMIASSVVCSWNAASTQSISSLRSGSGAQPISGPLGDRRMAVSASMTILRQFSFSSLSPRYSFSTISMTPTLPASSPVVSISCLQLRFSAAMRRTQKLRKNGSSTSLRTYPTSTPPHPTICFSTFSTILRISSSGLSNCRTTVGMMVRMYCEACLASMRGRMKPTALRKAPSDLSLISVMRFHSGSSTQLKASMPQGAAASAKAASASAVMDFTFFCGSSSPFFTISTRALRKGRMEQPMRMAICWTTLMPVYLASQLFLLMQTALRKGRRAAMPRALATTAKALEVVLRTNSSLWSMSGRMVVIMVGSPAALARLLMISRPSTRAQQSSSMSMGRMTTSILWTQGRTRSSSLQRMRSMTFTSRWRCCGSVVAISSGRMWLNSCPAPSSRALIVICRRADFRICGFPSLIFSSIARIFLSFCSSIDSSSSFTASSSGAKNLYSSGLIGGRSPCAASRFAPTALCSSCILYSACPACPACLAAGWQFSGGFSTSQPSSAPGSSMSSSSSAQGRLRSCSSFSHRSCCSFPLASPRRSGVLRLLGVGVMPAYPGVAPPTMGVLSSQRRGVCASCLRRGVSEKRLGVGCSTRAGVRCGLGWLGLALSWWWETGVASQRVRRGVVCGWDWLLLESIINYKRMGALIWQMLTKESHTNKAVQVGLWTYVLVQGLAVQLGMMESELCVVAQLVVGFVVLLLVGVLLVVRVQSEV